MGEGFSVNPDEMESIRLAIQLEFKEHEFYNRLPQVVTSDFEIKFYQHLAEEELVHLSTLRQNSTSFG